ncbi:MAG: PIN domain-containing protein [Bellilinea sp.]
MTELPADFTFVDTNVLVYAYDRSAGPKHAIAARLVENWWNNENGHLSLQILQEFYVSVTRKIAHPMDTKAARQIVSDLAQWKIHTPTVDDLLQAIDIQETHQISYWDAMVVQSAVRLGCTTLVSEDLTHGQIVAGVEIINPFTETKS